MFRQPRRIDKFSRTIDTANGVIEYILKRSTRRKSLTICIDEQANISVSAPYRAAVKHVEGFIVERSKWITDKVNQARENFLYIKGKEYVHGNEFLFLGKKYPINILENDCKLARVHFNCQGWHIILPKGLECENRRNIVKKQILKWYRLQAEEVLGGRIYHYSRIIGKFPKKISVRTQKRMWGCCDYNAQSVNLNWQIILSPIEVVDYVVVHELCHLIVPNHSSRFWSQVKKIMPDYDIHKKWLKDNFLEMTLP